MLFGSLANIATGFMHGIEDYAACRLIIAGLGIAGGLLAGWIGGAFGTGLPWRTAYFIGGRLGLVLLRLGVAVGVFA